MSASPMITIVIVDDHTLLRQALREVLDTEPDMRVIGEAGTSDDAVALVTRARPDVVLLDVEIPGDDVRTTMRRLRGSAPGTRVLVLSMYDEPQLVQDLLNLGARGYLLKSVSRHELASAIRSVRRDETRVVLAVSRRSLAQTGPGNAAILSSREIEVLLLAARAMSNAQIGARLSITESTVKRHLRNVFAKLGAVSRIDAVNKAAAAALIPVPAGPRPAPVELTPEEEP